MCKVSGCSWLLNKIKRMLDVPKTIEMELVEITFLQHGVYYCLLGSD